MRASARARAGAKPGMEPDPARHRPKPAPRKGAAQRVDIVARLDVFERKLHDGPPLRAERGRVVVELPQRREGVVVARKLDKADALAVGLCGLGWVEFVQFC
jgi:hypothetical protein